MLIEIHMLKNYPATNLNRDDSGAPKTCLFGGSTRGRISSQCLKRSWRTSPLFRNEVGETNLGIRTRKLPVLIRDKLIELGVDAEYAEAVMPMLTGFGNKEGKENKTGDSTAQVMFFSPDDIHTLGMVIQYHLSECASVKDVRKLKAKDIQAAISDANIRPISLDVALMGRMVTDDSFRNVEASLQVSHAISTNRVALESDFFTAMDDMLSGDSLDESGAAMIGDLDFNSCCYYSFSALDVDALRNNMSYSEDADDIIRKAIPALLRTMAFTNPSGKQNSFAGHVLPSVVYIEIKDVKIPVNLCNAFTVPVYGQDVVQESAKKLANEIDMVARNYGLPVQKRLWFCVDKYNDVKPETSTMACCNFQELVDAVAASL